MENGMQMTLEECMPKTFQKQTAVLRISLSRHLSRRKASRISRKPFKPVFQSYVPYRTAQRR